MASKEDPIQSLRESWRAEAESARSYRLLAEEEKDNRRKQVLLRMAEAEDRHAVRFEEKLRAAGAEIPSLDNGIRQRFERFMAHLLGVEIALKRMEAAEDRQAAHYGAQRAAALGTDEESARILHGIELEEKAHARAIQQMTPMGPQTALDIMMKRERWHGRGVGWVADAIYGVNDGLGAVFGIVSGVAGGTMHDPRQMQHIVLLSGIAATIASALSMGSGAYLAVKSEREVHEAEMGREQKELEDDPEEEKEEMALYYQLQGFDEEASRAMVERLSQDPEQMLRTMAQSELGLSEERLPNPWVSTVSATVSTAIGAFIPVIPFFFMSGMPAILTAAGVSLVAHFAVGAAKSVLTNRSWWASGTEMMLVGAGEGLITYGIGLTFGGIGG